jgi:hypothetical protein
VVISSQNWSQAGVRQNRDAGMIIESAPIAQYFQKVFSIDLGNARPFNPTGAVALKQTARKRK